MLWRIKQGINTTNWIQVKGTHYKCKFMYWDERCCYLNDQNTLWPRKSLWAADLHHPLRKDRFCRKLFSQLGVWHGIPSRAAGFRSWIPSSRKDPEWYFLVCIYPRSCWTHGACLVVLVMRCFTLGFTSENVPDSDLVEKRGSLTPSCVPWEAETSRSNLAVVWLMEYPNIVWY